MTVDDIRAALDRQDRIVPPPRTQPAVVLRAMQRRVRLRRISRFVGSGIAVALGAAAIAIAATRPVRPHVVVTAPTSPPSSPSTSIGHADVFPQRPAALAVAPDGALYIADDTRNQILAWRADQGFSVVAGDGVAGFSGDGHDATHARLNWPSGMTFEADGTLYFADTQNNRVRAISRNGTISTIVGRGSPGWVNSGTRALDATIQPYDVKLGPDGLLYIVSVGEVLRLEHNHTLTRVAGTEHPSAALPTDGELAANASDDGADAIAFDGQHGYYLAGNDSRALLYVTSAGVVNLPAGDAPFYPRGFSGLAAAPDGTVIAMDSQSIVRLTDRGKQLITTFPAPGHLGDVRNFQPNGIAVAGDGIIYVDTWNGNGYSDAVALAKIDPNTHTATLLWSHR